MTVAAMRAKLTDNDIRRLVKGTDPEDRAIAAHKLCRAIDRAPLTRMERESAHAIMQFMANDATELVRRALAVTLQNSPHLPHDLATKLANDIDSIAVPVISHSPVLEDNDLIDLVRGDSAVRQMAVAGRKQVSTKVVRVLVNEAREAAVAVAAANEGARFDEKAFEDTLSRFGDNAKITDGLISRDTLPVHITEKLVTMVSDEAMRRLAERHELPPQLAVELSEGARERATIDLVDQAGRAADMRRFVQQLHLNGRLTPSIILRGLCLGHIRFVEWSLAELAGVPHSRTWLMVHDAGVLGLRAIYDRAGLPSRLYPVFRAGVDMIHEMEFDGANLDRERFARKMIERTLSKFQGLPRAELDYLLDKLNVLSEETRGTMKKVA